MKEVIEYLPSIDVLENIKEGQEQGMKTWLQVKKQNSMVESEKGGYFESINGRLSRQLSEDVCTSL